MHQNRTHGGLPHRFFPLALCAALAACSPAGALGTSSASAQPGDVVGLLAVELPSQTTFTLHGTLPVPRGTWVPGGTSVPLSVRDHGGAIVPTQVEVTSRYPSVADGADVVELIARVTRPPGVAPGTRITYEVVLDDHAQPPTPQPITIDDLADGPVGVPASVQALLRATTSFVIEARDVFGNSYVCDPADGSGSIVAERFGSVSAQARVHQVLRPLVGGAQGALQHFLGLHSYLTTTAGEKILGLDLRFHNGHTGLDQTTPLDDPLGDVYFESINIYVPAGWVVVQDYFDPFLGIPTIGTGYVRFPLVKPNPDGSMHKMEWQAQFHRRLAICPASAWVEAQQKLRGAGLGFARRGTDPTSASRYWSWWNTDTSRWFAQSHLLPSLDHVGHDAIRQGLSKELADLRQHLELGTSDGDYPVKAPVLGWAHPYGVPYGGMAGGAEIHIFDGIETVETASTDGYRRFRILHRMHTDRMPSAFYNMDGEPTAVEDWLIDFGTLDYLPFFHFMLPTLGATDPFGISSAPTFQADYVKSQGLEPAYAAMLDGYDPHDFQHLIRYTNAAKVLTWLANDSLAQDDLKMQAENFHLSYHAYFNSAYQHAQVTGLKFDRDYVDTHVASGFGFGRGEAWALDCTAAAYATGTPQWRASVSTWLDRIADVLVDGQAGCSGFIQANVSPKFLFGNYRARQQIEQPITENAVRGLIESAYRGRDPGTTKALEDVLKRSFYAQISDMAWGLGDTAPWAFTAVGPLDDTLPVWCSFSEMPADGYTSYTDGFQNWSSFAYAYELTGDPLFMVYAQLQAGGPLLSTLESDGLSNLANKAALLGLVQLAAGIL